MLDADKKSSLVSKVQGGVVGAPAAALDSQVQAGGQCSGIMLKSINIFWCLLRIEVACAGTTS